MFRKFVLLAMVICSFSLLSGCATKHGGSIETISILLERIDQLQEPLIIVYGETGAVLLVQPGDKSIEREANIDAVLMEPGFIVAMSEKAHRSGLSDELEELLREECFFLQDSKFEDGI